MEIIQSESDCAGRDADWADKQIFPNQQSTANKVSAEQQVVAGMNYRYTCVKNFIIPQSYHRNISCLICTE